MTTISPSISRIPSVTSPPGQNPISLRLYKVLSANFDDDGTREALDTLAELYAPSTSAGGSGQGVNGNGKEVRLDGDYDVDVEDEVEGIPGVRTNGLVGAPQVEEGVPGDIAARARKNLRRDVESRLTESSRQFLTAFGEVDKQLDTLQDHIGLMRTRCDDAQTQLHETNKACKSLIDRAGSLREERQGVAVRQSIITLFLSLFTLSADEKDAITSRDVHIGPRFFEAMDKATKIRDDCRVLMTGDEGDTKAGVDILSATATQLEQAYNKIFRHCSFEFRQMGRDATSLDVEPSLREAVSRLKHRPELLQEALGYLLQTRQATLLSAFMDALTRGGPGGLPRPIELHAHDPLRYVGDMLAWVHQAIAAEREFLESLFGVRSARRMVGAPREFAQSEEEAWMGEMMDGAVKGLCGPLKVRVQQTVRSQESSITSYKIANLLGFYLTTMQRTIGREALLSRTLEELTELAYGIFHGAVEAQGKGLLRVPLDLDDAGVSPPLAILDHAQVLREMMVVYDSSLLGDENEEELQAGFRDILDKMVDPALEMCLTGANDKQRQRLGWDKAVFILNTLAYLQTVLEPFAFTVEKRGVVQGLVDAKVLQLIEEHYKDVLKDSGLADVALACDSRRPSEPLSHIPAVEPAALQSALHRFSEWLSGLEVVHSPRLSLLAVQSLHSRVHQAALKRLAETYERICDEVKKTENKIVNDPANEELIKWSDNGDSFYVLNHERFAREVLGRWFKHQKFASFVRQLNMYGFHKIPHLQQGVLKSDTDTEPWHFEHPNFHRGQPDLLCLIQRKKQPAHGQGDDVTLDMHDAAGHTANPLANITPGHLMDINSIVNGVAAIKRHQQAISSDLSALKQSNDSLWKEAVAARQRHAKHQDTINRILKFLAGVFGHTDTVNHSDDGTHSPPQVTPRIRPRLMIGDGRSPGKAKHVDIMEVDDDDADSVHSRKSFSSDRHATIETPDGSASSIVVESVATPEAFAPAMDISTDKSKSPPTIHPSQVLSRTSSGSTTPLLTNGSTNSAPTQPPPPPSTQDAVWQAAIQHIMSSPSQLQRLMQAFASQQPIPSLHPDNVAPHTGASAVQAYDPSQQDFSRWLNVPSSPIPSASSPAAPPILAPLHTDDHSQLQLLLDDQQRLQKSYRDASEIDADMDMLQSSINSLIQNLGIDPTSITVPPHEEPVSPTSPTSPSHPGADGHANGFPVSLPPDSFTNSLGGMHGLGDGPDSSQPDYLLDSLLSQIGDGHGVGMGPGGILGGGPMLDGYPDITDHYDHNTRIDGRNIDDASTEQLTAFLDEAASADATPAVAAARSPRLSPGASLHQKRKSDAADLSPLLLPLEGGGTGKKMKRKR
ncbi:hypothetical protein V8D89_014004 [Ganoderma adspersum]